MRMDEANVGGAVTRLRRAHGRLAGVIAMSVAELEKLFLALA